jgi:hypothetical protein
MVKLFEEEIHIMQLFYANQSIRNVRDISNATHDRPIPSIGTIFNIISKSLVFGIVGCMATQQCIDLCFLKLNIGNKYLWTMFRVKKMSRYITILLQIIFTVFKTQSTKGNFVTIAKFTINIKNMFYHKFLIPALNQGKGMQLHEPRQPSQRQYWFPLFG